MQKIAQLRLFPQMALNSGLFFSTSVTELISYTEYSVQEILRGFSSALSY